jgi:hypothetical protein
MRFKRRLYTREAIIAALSDLSNLPLNVSDAAIRSKCHE